MNQRPPANGNPPPPAAPRDPPADPGLVTHIVLENNRGHLWIVKQDSTWDPNWNQYRNGYLVSWLLSTGVGPNRIEMDLITASPNRRLAIQAQISARYRQAVTILGGLGANNPALVNAVQNELDRMRRANHTAREAHDNLDFEIPIPADAEGPLTNPQDPTSSDPVYIHFCPPQPGERNPAIFAMTCFFGARNDATIVRAERDRERGAPLPHQIEMARLQAEHQRVMQLQADQNEQRIRQATILQHDGERSQRRPQQTSWLSSSPGKVLVSL